MTIAEKIRSMTDEEIASFLCDLFCNECENCPAYDLCECGINGMQIWIKLDYEDDYPLLNNEVR